MMLRQGLSRLVLGLLAVLALVGGAQAQSCGGVPNANQICAAPNGSSGFPSFRAQVNADLPTSPANSVKGSIAGGAPSDLTTTQLTTLCNTVTGSLSGCVPAFPNNTTTFFRGDGTYQQVTGGAIAGGTVTNSNLANMTGPALKGITGAGPAAPADLTGAQAESILQFTQTGTGATQRLLDGKVKDSPITPYDFGAKGDGVTDDSAALVAWAASSGNNNKATYCPPGIYLTTQTLVFMPYQAAPGITPNTWTFDTRCIIRANAPMVTLVQFGSSASNQSGDIRNGIINGGLFDGNFNAQVAVWVPFSQGLIVSEQTVAENALFRNYRIGDVNNPSFTHSYQTQFSGSTYRSITPVSITNITQANPAVVTTSAAHNLLANQVVWINNVVGMTQVNATWFAVNPLTSTTFQLLNTDSTGFSAYTSGGVETGTAYGASVTKFITGITQANPAVVTTSQPHGYSNGQQVLIVGVVGMYQVDGYYTVAGATSTTFQLSGINSTGFSAYSSAGVVHPYNPQLTITGITNANPAVVTTSAPHGFTSGQQIFLENVLGMGGSVYGLYTVGTTTSTTFQLSGINSTSFGAYTSGGLVRLAVNEPLYGLCFENGSDNYVINGVLQGNIIGVGGCAGGLIYGSSIHGAHAWAANENGEPQACFDVHGQNKLSNLQCDGSFQFAYRFRDVSNKLINSNTSVSGGYNGSAIPIRIEPGAGVYSNGNNWFGTSSFTQLFEASAALSDRANYITGVNYLTQTPHVISNAPQRQWNGATSSLTLAGATFSLGSAGAQSGVTAAPGWVMGGACTINGAQITQSAAPGAGQTYTYTLAVNGVNTSITATAGASSFGAFLTGPYPVNALTDTVTITVVGSAGAAAAQLRYVLLGNC